MGGGVERLLPVAAGADRVGGDGNSQAVRVVAVAASDALARHPALQEGAVLVDLVLDLAVRVIKGFLEKGRAVAEGTREQRPFLPYLKVRR